jgi:hypothetical protein
MRLFSEVLQMFDNCCLYKDEEDQVIEEAARLFSLVPELYDGHLSVTTIGVSLFVLYESTGIE